MSGSPSPILRTNTEGFWSHRSRKEGLDNAGWSGRSYIVLLVVFVLNVDDGRMNGLSMLATMFSRLDVPNCDHVFLKLNSSKVDSHFYAPSHREDFSTG